MGAFLRAFRDKINKNGQFLGDRLGFRGQNFAPPMTFGGVEFDSRETFGPSFLGLPGKNQNGDDIGDGL